MKLPQFNGWTSLVVVAGIAGVFAMVHYKVSPETLGGYAAAMIGLAAALEKIARFVPKDGAK